MFILELIMIKNMVNLPQNIEEEISFEEEYEAWLAKKKL